MGKDLLKKTRIALFVDSIIKALYNINNTLMDVRMMNMLCTSLSDIAEVTDKIFAPASAETIPLPPILVYSNIFDHFALRGTLKFFEPEHLRVTEGFITDEVTAYVEVMSKITRSIKNKQSTNGTVFMSPPGYMFLPRPIQQILYLVLEAAYAKNLNFYLVAPNLRISATTWRPCEASFPAFVVEMSKALQAYTGYEGNSLLLIDEATAYDYGMQLAHRSIDKMGVRQILCPNGHEREDQLDNLWNELRDESTLDEKTHDAKFQKELTALFKTTEAIKGDRMNTTVFPMAAVALDAETGMASPTLALLIVLAQNLARQNEKETKLTHQTWHQLLAEPLSQVAERLGIAFSVFLYNISPYWFPNFVQAEYNLDEQRLRLYVEAMEKAAMSEILAYLGAVGLQAINRRPTGLLQKLVFDKGSVCLFSFLVFARNHKKLPVCDLECLGHCG